MCRVHSLHPNINTYVSLTDNLWHPFEERFLLSNWYSTPEIVRYGLFSTLFSLSTDTLRCHTAMFPLPYRRKVQVSLSLIRKFLCKIKLWLINQNWAQPVMRTLKLICLVSCIEWERVYIADRTHGQPYGIERIRALTVYQMIRPFSPRSTQIMTAIVTRLDLR